MDADDHQRALSNKEKIRLFLKTHGAATNHRLRGIGGSRAMARVHELIHEGEPIHVRKLVGSTWEIRYAMPPLGRDSRQSAAQKSLF